MMQKEKLGIKRICAECNAKYYDLIRRNVQCPKCGCTTVENQKSKFKMTKPVEVEIETNDADFIDTDDDAELLPLDSLEAELS